MAPKVPGMSHSETCGSPGAKSRPGPRQGSTAGQPCLPFGLSMSNKSRRKVRNRCILLSALFLPVGLWHFVLGPYIGESLNFSGVDRITTSAAAVSEDVVEPRRLIEDNTTWVSGMEHGYDCLTQDEQYDRDEIGLKMVRKYHVTMGGRNGTGCRSGEGPCIRKGEEYLLLLYLPSMFYMFVALAIICDEFFVPSLEAFVEHYKIDMDIAGATFMAAGGSMPELFTSLISVFDESDVGFAAIVGSAVFNVLFVIAVCAIASKEVLVLTWWPLARDCTFYIIGLALVVVFFSGSSPSEIEWWEALLLFIWYCAYCGFMTVNGKVKDKVEAFLGASKKKKAAVSPEPEAIMKPLDQGEDKQPINLKKPSQFRGSIIQLLKRNSSMHETVGVTFVTEMKDTLEEVFKKLDTDNNGHINEAEFTQFMHVLGLKHDEIRDMAEEAAASKLWKILPLNKDQELSFEDFQQWYIVSQARIEIEVRKLFEKLDSNGDNELDEEEISRLMYMLGHDPTPAEISKMFAEMARLCEGDAEAELLGPRRIKYEQFEKWYMQSVFCSALHKKHEQEKEEDEQGFSIDWPDDADALGLFWYFFTYPLCAVMYCSLPDVRRPGMEGKVRWAVLEFVLSLLWIACFSNALYECTIVCSNTIGIPPPVAAVTILAAGTSVPDLLSSYIVAKKGEGDMAVSSSIGSNIFDITVGLPIPWMLYSIVKGGKNVQVGTKSLGFSVLVLMLMLAAVVLTVMAMKWRMTNTLGYVMISLYVIFLVQDLLQQLPKSDPILQVGF